MAFLLPLPSRPGKPGRFQGSFLPAFRQTASDQADLFRPCAGHETKRHANETISGVGEDIRKLVMVINPPNE